MYDPAEIDEPVMGDWARDDLPYVLRVRNSLDRPRRFGVREVREARRAFYALCTHIDHQLRLAFRMVTDGRAKLICYPAANRLQLFDTVSDPQELHDLSAEPVHAVTRDRLTAVLRDQLTGVILLGSPT